MGRGGTPYEQVVPREDNLNGARVKMLRPRRVYVGADLERLYADYLTHLACRAAEFGIPISPDELLFRNLDRPALLSPLREGTVRDKVSALKRRRIGPESPQPARSPAGGPTLVFAHCPRRQPSRTIRAMQEKPDFILQQLSNFWVDYD